VDTRGGLTTIDVPGAVGTVAWGINDTGQSVGDFYDAFELEHGFMDMGGNFTTIDVPGAFGTYATGITDGQIVGSFYNLSGVHHGFVDAGDSFITIDVPGAICCNITDGINNGGQIVGTFEDANGLHGFLAAPVPEPSSLTTLTLTACLMALIALVYRRNDA
jgi:hypothetical protein